MFDAIDFKWNEEEEEAIVIEELNQLVEKSKDLREEEYYSIFTIHEVQNIATALNLIQKQQEEIQKEEYKYRDLELKYEQNLKMTKHFREELQKQDKVIDKMAKLIQEIATSTPGTTFYYLRKQGFDDSKCKNCNLQKKCEDCIKQYFESKV